MAVREVVSFVIFLGVMFSLIGRYGLDSIGIASLVTSGLQGVFFLPISIKRYRQTSNFDPPGDNAAVV
jgi:hypothetical protein